MRKRHLSQGGTEKPGSDALRNTATHKKVEKGKHAPKLAQLKIKMSRGVPS